MRTKEEIQSDLIFRCSGIKYILAMFMICTIGLKFSTDPMLVEAFLTGVILMPLTYGFLVLWKIPRLKKELSKHYD